MTRLWDWFESWPSGALTFVDVVASVATAFAAVLAAVTIVQPKRQAAEAQRALIHERQVDHQLDQLMWLLDNLHKGSNVSWVDAGMRQRAALLPMELVPLTRASLGLPSTPEGKARVQQVKTEQKPYGRSAKDAMAAVELRQELEAALTTTLASRPSITVVSGVSDRVEKR